MQPQSRPWQAERFCRQYLQIEPTLDYPEAHLLRQNDVQNYIFNSVFDEGAVLYKPPARYQVKTLKELVLRIEDSIDDWDQHVSITSIRQITPPTCSCSLSSVCLT